MGNLFLSSFLILGTRAESHRATQLGNPATRFADPITTVADLRERFRNAQLRADMEVVLRKWGWKGDVEDLFRAAATAEVADTKIAIGQVMPFMSSRENTVPICLRNVTWAGKEPAPAYSFLFTSRGRNYRCVTPKACSNFFVEELGEAPRHGLAVDCIVTNQTLAGRQIEACLTVRNTGNVMASSAKIVLPVPPNTTLAGLSEGGLMTTNSANWVLTNLQAGESRSVCAFFKTQIPGLISFRPKVTTTNANAASAGCDTTVLGVSGLLLENADDPDPVPLSETTTYTVRVTNQGTADDTEVKIVVEFPEEIDPVTASNRGEVTGKTVTFPPYSRLAPKEKFEYTITAKGVKTGDARVKFIRTSSGIQAPTTAEESTRVY